jgi:predicted TIM-barrel fold metal-dependent hydrolase
MSRLIISADSHVMEPPDLWQERLPAALRSRAPRQEIRDGRYVLLVEGAPPRTMGRVGDEEHRLPAGSDPAARLRDLETDGVAGEVIYPTVGLFLFLMPDAGLQLACTRVYNDWCAERFLAHADVFAPAAILPIGGELKGTLAELERVAGLGFKAAMLPATAPEQARYNSAAYDPLWENAAAARISLSFHVGTGAVPITERGPGGAVINYLKVSLASQEVVSYFAAAGVLARHPALHVVVVEAGAGWLAHVCERMDEAYTEHAQWVSPKLDGLPSDYVKRQVHVTLGSDRAAILARAVTGVEPLLWASDYPHPEGTWPHSREVIERSFAGLPDGEIDAIVGTNAQRLYRLATTREKQT